MKKIPFFTVLILLANFAFAGIIATPPAIINFGNVDLTEVPPEGIASDINFCVYTNDKKIKHYRVSACGSVAGKYKIQNGDSTINYSAKWNDKPAVFNNFVFSGCDIPAPKNFNASTEINCGEQNNTNLQIAITKQQLTQASAGSYLGTITFLITPQ